MNVIMMESAAFQELVGHIEKIAEHIRRYDCLSLKGFPGESPQILRRGHHQGAQQAGENRHGHADETVEQEADGREIAHQEHSRHTGQKTAESGPSANAREEDAHQEQAAD